MQRERERERERGERGDGGRGRGVGVGGSKRYLFCCSCGDSLSWFLLISGVPLVMRRDLDGGLSLGCFMSTYRHYTFSLFLQHFLFFILGSL